MRGIKMINDDIAYFSSVEERNALLISWKLATSKNVTDKVFYYKSCDDACKCRVIGYCPHEAIKILAIEVEGKVHKVLAAYFKEMQSGKSRMIPAEK